MVANEMIKIISLDYIKKKWVLQLENYDDITLNEEIVAKYNLVSKDVISKTLYLDIIDENNYYQALDKSLKFLRRIKSEKEVRDHLYESSYSSGIIQQVISYLIKYRYINDEVIISDMLSRSISNKKKTFNLEKKGIDKTVFSHLLGDETPLIKKDFSIYLKRIKEWNYESKQKSIRHLLSKGYAYEDVRKVVEEFNNLDENI